MSDKLKVLDLFSGIGGFSLGLERTGGFETVAFCEIEDYPKRVLKKHWPEVPIYDDVKTVTADRLFRDGIRPSVITAGFPCQDISLAGKQAGIDAERSGLWSECARLLREIRPRWAIFENVPNLLNGCGGDWFKRVLWDIFQVGYDAEWHCIPASYAGARQLRDRGWIMAYPHCDSIQGGSIIAESWRKKSRTEQLARLVQPCAWPTISESRNRGDGDGVTSWVHQNRAVGNAVVPQIPEMIGYAILEAENATS